MTMRHSLSNVPQPVADLYREIRQNVETPDGSWNGGDVVDVLTTFFASYGLEVDGPNPFEH